MPALHQSLALLVAFGAWGPALAKSASRKKAAEAAEAAEVNEAREDEPTRLKVPREVRGRGYELRIDGESYRLDRDTVTLRDGGGGDEEALLLDPSGRIVGYERTYVDQELLQSLTPNRFRVGLHVGGVTVEKEKFRELFQDLQLEETSLDFAWQPSALGLAVSYASIASSESVGAGLDSEFRESQLRVAALYELVPFRYARGHVNRLHLGLSGGAMHVTSSVALKDAAVELTDAANAWGAYAAADLSYPIYSFWLTVRVYGSYHRLKLEKVDHESDALRRALLLGGSYAF